MRYEEPVKILEIMRLSEQGFSQRTIAASVLCSKSTVGEVVRRCRNAGMDYTKLNAMDYDIVVDMLYPKLSNLQVKDDPDWGEIHRRLTKFPRLNLQFIWTEEYILQNPDGLSYSQFCRRYRAWKEQSGMKVSMVREHDPGKEMFVDWAGDTLPLVRDCERGEVQIAHFFIATLGCSAYPFAMAFPNENEPSWLSGHIHAFEYYGGVPRILIPDNTKAAVTKPNYYDPELNKAYRDLSIHYGVGIVPARPWKPKDKAYVEGSVGWLETWLFEWLRGKEFFGFDELNRQIRLRVQELAERPFQGKDGTRQSMFDSIDAPALRPLPRSRFEYCEYKNCRVGDNYHVEFRGFYYSVPHTLFKQIVRVKASENVIEIFDASGHRVAMHERAMFGKRYVSDPMHMPEKHRHQLDRDKRDGDSYRSWAESIGANTGLFIDGLLRAQVVEETAYKSCMGVLQMSSKFGADKLERTCEKALSMGSITYTTVKRLINSPLLDTLTDDAPTQTHDNLRDPAEFQ